MGLGGVVGITLGVVAGYLGGSADAVTSRIFDAVFGIPVVVLAVSVVAVFGTSNNVVAAAIAIGMAPVFGRLARAGALKERSVEYIEACRSLGANRRRILFRHIFPNVIGPLIVQLAFGMSVAAIIEASLGFLGLGSQPPAPSWGSMMFDGMAWTARVTPLRRDAWRVSDGVCNRAKLARRGTEVGTLSTRVGLWQR